jgi:hypothetical protein
MRASFERPGWTWWACGVDATVLTSRHCPSVERVRFSALGALVLVSVAISFLAAAYGADLMFFDQDLGQSPATAALRVAVCLAIGTMWAVFVLNLLRLTVGLAGRRTDRLALNIGDLVRAFGIFLVTAAIALPAATPLQIVVTERDAAARALAINQVRAISEARLADQRRVDQSTSESDLTVDRLPELDPSTFGQGFFSRVSLALDTNIGLCAAIYLGIWLLILLPPSIRLLTDRGAYDFLVSHRNRQWLAESGIEPDAYTVFTPDGAPIMRDAFHAARTVYRHREAQILASRRYDNELQRQIAAVRLEETRRGLEGSRDVPRSVSARKKITKVSVVFATERREITTLEGPVVAEVGDAIVTAKTGETWPVPRETFASRYVAAPSLVFGNPGTYYSKPLEVRATRLVTAASVEVAHGRSQLDAKPGDWLINYGDGSNGVIAPEIFEQTYEILDR